MSNLPPLNALRAFDAAGRNLNFRAAADELKVTQGAVAQHVRALEAHLGVTLFERVPKGLAFTPTGRSYHQRIAAIFRDLKDATDLVRPEPSRVVVSVTPTFASKWLIPNLHDFSSRHPDINLQILATEKISNLLSDGIDISVRQGQPPFGAALVAVHLFDQDVIAVAAPALVVGENLPLEKHSLARLPKLHDAHNGWPDFLRSLELEDQSGHGLRFSQTTLAIDAALSGQGIALVSHFLVERDLNSGNLVQVMRQSLRGKNGFYLLTEKQKLRRSAIAAVHQWIVDKATAGADPR